MLVLAAAAVFLTRPADAGFALYSPDYSDNKILKFNAQGQATVFATNGVNGGVLSGLGAMAMDNLGYLYVVNLTGTNTIEKFDPFGNGSLFASLNAAFYYPVGLAMDAFNNLYFCQKTDGNILKVSNPPIQSSVFNSATVGGPLGLAFDQAGNLFVSDFTSGHIYELNGQGAVRLFATVSGSNPVGLAFDSAGNLYVALYASGAVMRYDSQTNATAFWSGLSHPYGLAFDSSGNLYVGCVGDTTIRKMDAQGNKSIFASSANGLTGTGFIIIQETRYTENWFKAAGGGGTSANTEFLLNGTAGQQDAGAVMTGGQYAMTGGFWTPISVVPTPGAPALAITITTTNTAIVSWPSPSTGWNLQQNTNLAAAAWVASPATVNNNGTINYVIVNPPTERLFFRLEQ